MCTWLGGIVSTMHIYVFELSTERMIGLGWRKCRYLFCMPIYFCNFKTQTWKERIMSFCTAIPALLVAFTHIAKYAGYWP